MHPRDENPGYAKVYRCMISDRFNASRLKWWRDNNVELKLNVNHETQHEPQLIIYVVSALAGNDQ